MTRSQWIALFAAAVACFGLVDSTYLTIKHLQGSYIRCGDACSAVLGSKYAEGVAGIPLAGFGAMAYITVLAALLLTARRPAVGRLLLTIIAPAMALVSVWLIYLQAFVIHAFCQYCLASAAASFTLAGLVLIDRLGKQPRAQDVKPSAKLQLP
jgi:uncharacterized membrane protein